MLSNDFSVLGINSNAVIVKYFSYFIVYRLKIHEVEAGQHTQTDSREFQV